MTTTYDLISLVPSGDVFMVQTRSDGRVFSSIALTQEEAEGDFEDMHYEDELDAEAYALGIVRDLDDATEHDELPRYGDRYVVVRARDV